MLDVIRRLSVPPEGAKFGSGPETILGSALVCSAAFGLLQATGIALPKSGPKLKRADVLQWNMRVVSTVHALILTFGTVSCLRETLHLTPAASVVGYAHAPDVLARVFLGYLIYDLTFMLVYWNELRDASGIVHHVLFMPSAAYVLAHSIMAFPFCWLSFCEVSTPFVNYRWHLAATGRKEEKIYMRNGLLVAALFFVSRVVLYGLGLAHLLSLSRVWGPGSGQPLGHTLVVGLFVLGYALNLYWMAAIVKAARRAVQRGSGGTGSDGKRRIKVSESNDQLRDLRE